MDTSNLYNNRSSDVNFYSDILTVSTPYMFMRCCWYIYCYPCVFRCL